MRCKDIESLLVDYYENALFLSDRESVEQHLVQCESCKLKLKEVESTYQLLENQSIPPIEESFWINFLPEVRYRIEKEKMPPETLIPQTGWAFDLSSFLEWWKGLVRWARPAVAVAVLLICIFLGYSLGNFSTTANGQTTSPVDERTIVLQQFFDSHYLNPLNDLPTGSLEATYRNVISEE